ncbi:MAG: 2-hydroxyacyl-CoA dehydratase family protein [Archaeoglobaceae archaeon]|nr:2-hydroxyacyl-CoA dehydratase family protein [Archaeoglobaceae archaeon]MDW8118166.1 2-hydroxyacyl-CoA dehydratase family protein [Archaeoglobaceae archaeon]
MLFDKLQEISTLLENEYIKDWKSNGGFVIGHACIALPREIAEAGRILPFRLRGNSNSDTSTADSYLSRYNCTLCRSCLELVLNGSYDFLDGFIRVRGCDHWMGTFDEILHAKKAKFIYYFKVPHLVNEDTLKFFTAEIMNLKNFYEKNFGMEISEDEIVNQIKLQDRINDKMMEFSRKRFKKPNFYGSEAISLAIARESIPSKAFESLIEEVLKEGRKIDFRAKFVLGGSPLDEIELIKKIEEMGAIIVSETTCFGCGAFWNMKRFEDSDLYEFLAEKYLENLKICARMFGEYNFRKNFLKQIFEISEADGVILTHNKFCDLFGIENAKLRMDLEKDGIPVLLLEKEYASSADIGRIKTRVQAFMERLGR